MTNLAPSPGTTSVSYLLQMTPEDKAWLEVKARERGKTLAEVLRRGAYLYLTSPEAPRA